MQNLTTDIDSIGGGGFGGLGGFGNNPLLWLITLGFLKDGGIGGNNQAGADSAKLDCLAQQHGQLADQIRGNTQQGQFAQLSNEVSRVAEATRDSRDLFTGQVTTLAQSLAECCCDLKTGQQSIKTDVAMQTATLQAEGSRNTQAILDKLCSNEAALKDAEIRSLEQRLQTQTIVQACNGGGGHNNIDINVLARALQGQGQAA